MSLLPKKSSAEGEYTYAGDASPGGAAGQHGTLMLRCGAAVAAL